MDRALVALALVAGCQYGAAFSDCEIACHAPADCPPSLTCGSEGLCRINGNTISCMAVLGDAHMPDAPVTTAHCTGTPTACTAYAAQSSCTGQSGCGWTATTCKLTIDCSQYTTNQDCMNAAGCATDFTTSTCKPQSGYCSGSSKTACEQNQNCMFSGGCSGTAKPCNVLTTSSACGAQAGCSWH